MGLRNCMECGKVCMETPSKLCPDCYAKEEEYEHIVGEYLRDNGRASIEQIHQATGVAERIVMRMLKAGRLFSDGMIGYPCEMCRRVIYEGRLCSGCGSGLMKQVQKLHDDQERHEHDRSGLRMYTRDGEKK